MRDGDSEDVTRLDDALSVLSSSLRRDLLWHMLEQGDDMYGWDDLAELLAKEHTLDERTIRSRLAHIHLPKMADLGVIEYDRERETVRPGERIAELRPLLEEIRVNRDG